MSQSTNPKATSPWLDTVPDSLRFEKLTKDISTDVVVVGGGIVGIMTAWRLAANGMKVVVLERNHMVTGDTAFTTAFITRVPDTSAADLKERYGADFVKRVFAATTEAQDWFKNVIKTEGIDCDYADVPSYNCAYATDDESIAEEWSAIGAADPKASVVHGAEASAHFSEVKEAIKFDGEARYHVRKFLLGLLKRPGAANIKVYEEADVQDIDVSDSGVRVVTATGVVSAKKVVVTTGLPHQSFAELLPWFSTRLTFVIAAKFAGGAPIGDAMFWDTDEPYQYYRRLDANSIILGGCDRDASDTPEPGAMKPVDALKGFLDKRMKGAAYEVTHTWSGSMFETEDGLPFLSEHPSYKGRVFIGSGFGGNGMVCGALAGMVLGDLAAGKANAHSDVFAFARIGKPVPKPAPRAAVSASGATSGDSGLLDKPLFKRFVQILLPIIYVVLAIIPAHAFFAVRGGVKTLSNLPASEWPGFLFPLFGLYAFFLIWAQIMIGTMMPLLRRVYKRIEIFHRAEGVFALLFGLTHPILLVVALGFPLYISFGWTDESHILYVMMGEVQLFLLMLTACTALAMRHPWLKQRWHVVHYCNYVLFSFAWVHGLRLGSDFSGDDMRMKVLWMILGATGLLAIAARIYRAVRGSAAAADTGSSTGAWVVVAKEADLPLGKPFRVKVDTKTIALVKLPDGIYAINNVCGHAGGPLDEGPFSKYVIECPWHGSQFDVRTGAVVAGPATRPQKTYKVMVENGVVKLQM